LTAAANKDRQGENYLLEHGCFLTKPGLQISVLDIGLSGTRVRAYVPESTDAVEPWTAKDSLQVPSPPISGRRSNQGAVNSHFGSSKVADQIKNPAIFRTLPVTSSEHTTILPTAGLWG
jgi:hypothetical protein